MPRGSGTHDVNGTIAALLQDLAVVQTSEQRRWAYNRAAAAIRDLEGPVQTFLQKDGTLQKIRHVGPSSARVVYEVLATGDSPTVEAAVAASSRRGAVEKSRSLRSNFLTRSQVIATLREPIPDGVSLGHYRGDLQMHSVWSDGSQTLDAIVASGLERGYQYCGVTDHSHGLPIAGGLSMTALTEQQAAIDALNERHRGRFRLIKSIEANILADGTLDMKPEELRRLEIVVAAPHAALRLTTDQTERMLRVVRTAGVHILGHPRGRKYGTRPGVTADWPRVFAEAARHQVAIEIDGDPSRQDVDYELARVAVDAGCLLALDSDAHSAVELEYAKTAIAHARLAGVPVERVINCWPVEQLLDWARR
jgi:histidinol phosphatase-like PHP family hydrolase/sulfur relay (sulfurtransferase) complex TusBCD TusD component (DsrE family)